VSQPFDVHDQARALVEPYPTLIRALAITAIVLGVLGVLIALWGVFGLVLQGSGMASMQAPSNLPYAMQGPYNELMQAQQDIALYSAFPTILSGLISVFMIVAGVQSVQQRQVGLMPYAALGAALADLVAMVIMPTVNYFLMRDEIQAYFDAVLAMSAGPEAEMMGQIMSGTMTATMAFNVLFGLAFVGFWIWAFTALSRHATLTGETG